MPPQETNNHKKFYIVTVFLIVFVAVFLYLFIFNLNNSSNEENNDELSSYVNTEENVKVKNNDNKVPEGFPFDISISSTDIITESHSMTYLDRKVVQYVVNFKTKDSLSDTYNKYLAMMVNAGYIFDPKAKDEKNGFLYGTKDNDDLSLVISSNQEKLTNVTITYIDRQ